MLIKWKPYLTEVLTKDGSWRPKKWMTLLDNGEISEYDSSEYPLPDVYVEHHTLNFGYDYKDTHIQKTVKAQITMQRTTRNRFRYLPWPRTTNYYIDVFLSEGIGERSSAWGGYYNRRGFKMKPGETIQDTLWRVL